MSCTTDLERPGHPAPGPSGVPPYAWTDLTYLLDRAGVSWRYFVQKGAQPDCTNAGDMVCPPLWQSPRTPDIWNPLPGFRPCTRTGNSRTSRRGRATSRWHGAVGSRRCRGSCRTGPTANTRRHRSRAGQAWVTRVMNAAMRSPDWNHTAIFLSWDDWGGFYDHVVPPTLNGQGLGLRVPGLVISPYAQTGMIDHQTLSPDAYLRFIEDDFLGGQRLDPADGRQARQPPVRGRDHPGRRQPAGRIQLHAEAAAAADPAGPPLTDPAAHAAGRLLAAVPVGV